MMSDDSKKNSQDKVVRMVDKGDDENRFGYRPPSLKAKTQKDTEERGYVPPKKPRRPSSSDSSGNNKSK